MYQIIFDIFLLKSEKIKILPFSDLWEEYCKACGVETDEEKWDEDILKCEKDVLNLII